MNIDAAETAGELEIWENRSANFHPDRKGLDLSFHSMFCVVSALRHGAPMAADWKEEVERDYNER